MLRQESTEVTLSIDKTAVFNAEYQFDDLDLDNTLSVVGLYSYDADTGEEVNLTNLLLLQIETIQFELQKQCMDAALELIAEDY